MQLDLNLLTALDALLETGSVAGAAARLYLSAPAMSRTLGRIRAVTGDRILVRTGRTMTPTPYALAVRQETHALVERARALLSPERDLDLATLERVFTLQCHDALTTAVAPGLIAAVRAQAPGVALRLLAEATTDTLDLRNGHVDLALGDTAPPLADIRFEAIGYDRPVIAVRPDHPLAEGELTIERYAQASHLIVSRRGRLQDPIDEALAARGLQRRVVAAAPTIAAALHCVCESDLVVIVAESVSGPLLARLGLRTQGLPFAMPALPIIQAWHQRYDNDKAHQWLRSHVRATLQTICQGQSHPEA